MNLISQPAPDFVAPAVMPDGSINGALALSDYRGHYVVLLFYPNDFTFVCPTEIISHHRQTAAFRALGVQLLGISVDSQFSHAAWRDRPVARGGIGTVDFPLVADIRHTICRAYGVEHPDGVALRASFLIDRAGVVQHQVVNNLALGRRVDEMLRVVEALQFTEQFGEVCPAGWNKGKPGMQPSAQGVADYLREHGGGL